MAYGSGGGSGADGGYGQGMIKSFRVWRKQHKKEIATEAVKKRHCATKKPYSRSIVGANLEVIQKRRTEKAEVRDAAREAALREIKERIKKAKKAEVQDKTQKAGNKL